MFTPKKTVAVIRKIGDQYCVFSKDGKNLGCSDSKKGAQKRLQQVEFFKQKAENEMSNFRPDKFGDTSSHNKKSMTPLTNDGEKLSKLGTIAGRTSSNILDTREHFPIRDENQARSAIKRVSVMTTTPIWFSGSIEDLQTTVYLGVSSKYPNIRIPTNVNLEAAMANLVKTDSTREALKSLARKKKQESRMSKADINDAFAVLQGDAGVKDKKSSVNIGGVNIKNPDSNMTKVPGIPRKNLQSEAAFEDRHAIARSLMDLISDQKKALQSAEKVAKRLEKQGLTGDEFKKLMLFLQEDILHELLRNGAKGNGADAMKRVLQNRKEK